jgi:transposase
MAKRKQHTATFKMKVVEAAIKNPKVTETARAYGVTAGLVSKWKKQLEENGHTVFETTPDKENRDLKKKIEKLEQIIGKKEVEIALIKNFVDFYESHGGK